MTYDSTRVTNTYIDATTGLNIKSTAGPGIVNDNGSVVYNQRFHVAIADVNGGLTLLSAIPGYKYRMVACKAIAVGGAVGAVTTVDILATQAAGSVKLVAYAQASLTQSAVLVDGGTGGTVIADGASYQKCDVNTAITIGKTGATATTATFVDVILSYAIET